MKSKISFWNAIRTTQKKTTCNFDFLRSRCVPGTPAMLCSKASSMALRRPPLAFVGRRERRKKDKSFIDVFNRKCLAKVRMDILNKKNCKFFNFGYEWIHERRAFASLVYGPRPRKRHLDEDALASIEPTQSILRTL